MKRIKRQEGLKERAGKLILRLFPERQIHLRTKGRVSFVRFTTSVQIVLFLLFLGAAGWMGYATLTYVRHDTIIAGKDKLISGSRQAYRGLLGEVSEYQRKFNALSTDLEDSRDLMLGLVEKNISLQNRLSSVSKKLRLTRKERQEIATARENLKNKMVEIEDKVHKITNRNFSLSDNLNTAEADLQRALAERNKALYEGNQMTRRIKKLESRLTTLQETEEKAVQHLTNRATTYIKTMEKVVSMAGLNIKRIIKNPPNPADGQGGPFIAARSDDDVLAKQLEISLANLDLHLNRWKALQDLMQRIPLSPPLRSFYVTSSFGKRRDPINRRWAAHYGLDLGGPFKSAVYSTAPGVVTYAGWKGKYGKLVEINHGKGIKTRYGHLSKFYVKKGQKVKFHKKIGLLGSTGRSTGAHLHYEVIFRGRAKNPMKFIRAGYDVFQK